ncbi:MAG: hypothetical protein U0263_04370 [Polyangiaceae bacterium]
MAAPDSGVEDYGIASASIEAVKPGGKACCGRLAAPLAHACALAEAWGPVYGMDVCRAARSSGSALKRAPSSS